MLRRCLATTKRRIVCSDLQCNRQMVRHLTRPAGLLSDHGPFCGQPRRMGALPGRRRFSTEKTSTGVAGLYSMTFVSSDGSKKWECEYRAGMTILKVAKDNDVDIEGACGGQCACSTCHIYIKNKDMFDKFPQPDENELDMLDMALDMDEDTSRLGCQLKLTAEHDGLEVQLPAATANQLL
mmetsp:Transcript_54044/g.135899  ORF Transcript_54044/g.135899 Transcript_54044/m.135899 type:complete len:181 (-) Transcript_54044:277-819(-)